MKILLIASIAFAGFAATPAQAQRGETVGAKAAQCVVVSDNRLAQRLLGTLPGSTAEARLGRELGPLYKACGGAAIFSAGTLDTRGEVALALVERRLATGADTSAVATAPLWYAALLEGRTAGRDYDPVQLGLQQFGGCMLRGAPDASVALLRSPRGSADERSAVARLKPVIPGCVSQGQTLRLTATNLRLLLAEPAYHAIAK